MRYFYGKVVQEFSREARVREKRNLETGANGCLNNDEFVELIKRKGHSTFWKIYL